MRGRLISKAAYQKKIRRENYEKLITELRNLEQQHKNSKDETILQQITLTRRQIDDILRNEIEKKTMVH